jgi:hypothetical protein
MTDPKTPKEMPARPFRLAFLGVVLLVLGVFVVLTLVRLIDPTSIPGLNTDIMQRHWPAVFGIPLSALLALFVVLLTTTMTGEIKFELGPIKVSGAAGESLIWLLGFFLGVWAFKELWSLPQ